MGEALPYLAYTGRVFVSLHVYGFAVSKQDVIEYNLFETRNQQAKKRKKWGIPTSSRLR